MGCSFPHNAGQLCLLVHFVLENYLFANETFVQAHFVDEGITYEPQNNVSHCVSSNVGCCNNLSVILHFTGLAKELYQKGAKMVAMDNGCLA